MTALPRDLDPSLRSEGELVVAIEKAAASIDPDRDRDRFEAVRLLASHPLPRIRYHAREALSTIRERHPLPPQGDLSDPGQVGALLDSPDPEIRLRGALAAYRLQSPSLFDSLYRMLGTDPDPFVRASLVKAVAGYRNNLSLPRLLRCLEDPDGRVRANTVEGLAGWDNPIVQKRLSDMLEDPEHRVQAAVLTWLGRGGSSIREHIERMLASNLVWLQASAVYVVGTLSPDWGIEVLGEFLKHGAKDRRLRGRVVNWIGVMERRRSATPTDHGTGRPDHVEDDLPRAGTRTGS